VGSTAAFALGVREDLGLLVAGISALLLFLPGRSRGAAGRPEVRHDVERV
jgi:hypothetical protein